MIDDSTIPARNPSVIGQNLQGEAVLLLPLTGEIKVLNEVGARIWELIDGRRTLEQISAALQAEYQVAAEEARADTRAFLAELLARNMITRLPT